MKMKKWFRTLRKLSVFMVLATALLLPGMASAAGNAVVTVNVSAGAVAPGQQFTVDINVVPNNAIAGLQFNLSFNPALVTAVSVAEGNLFRQGGASTYFNTGVVNNATGTITGGFGVIITPGQTVSAPGTFATITMTALAGGTCPLTLSGVVIGDINGASVPADVVNGSVVINRPPVLGAIGNRTVAEGAALSFTIAATDPDNNPLTYSASGLPSGAAFTPANRTFSWTPTYDQAGTYNNVRFQVSDGYLTDYEDIAITVTGTNRAPVLGAIGNRTVAEGAALSFAIAATDPDGGALTYSATGLPTGASFTPATGAFAWTPTYDQAGTYSGVRFTVSDGSLTDYEDIIITVTGTNRAPVLNAIGNRSVTEGQLLTFTIAATDPDGGALTYSAAGLPPGASFNPATRTFSWTPTYEQAGSYANIRLTVSDGSLTDYEDITITVTNIYTEDVNHDGAIDVLDIISVAQRWNQSGTGGWIDQDVNDDGAINVLDVIRIGQHWSA
jgi:hypothetical protein